jgi:hypothetical protein
MTPEMTELNPAGPGGEREAEEMQATLRRAAQARRDQAEIAADDEGASATAEVDDGGDAGSN